MIYTCVQCWLGHCGLFPGKLCWIQWTCSQVSVKQISHGSVSCLASPIWYDDTLLSTKKIKQSKPTLWKHNFFFQFCHQNRSDREQLGHKWFELYAQSWLLTLMGDKTVLKTLKISKAQEATMTQTGMGPISWRKLRRYTRVCSLQLCTACWGIISWSCETRDSAHHCITTEGISFSFFFFFCQPW